MRSPHKLLRHARKLHRIESVLVATATGGAVSALHGLTIPGVPLDRIGALADIGAGTWAATHWLLHRRAHKHARDRGDGSAEDLE
jgi:hypothetical protein